MMESPAVRELADRHIAHGLRALRVDLRDCTAIDSTFSGMLLSLEHQLATHDGTLTLVSPSSRVQQLLGQLGVDDVYAVEFAPRTRGPWLVLDEVPPDADKLRRLVLESHDELAHASIADATGFRAVVDELRRKHA